jgi:hypothetical protein
MRSHPGPRTGWRHCIHGQEKIYTALFAALATLLLGDLTAAPPTPAFLPQVTLRPDPNPVQAFGATVAIDANTVVVGSLYDGPFLTGSAYVFIWDGTAWARSQKLVPTGGAVGDAFGWSVAVSGNTIVVGTYSGDKTYIFARTGGSWSLQQILGVSGTVAIDDDTLLVANPNADVAESSGSFLAQAGMAWIWTRKDNAWSLVQALTASDPRERGFFGTSGALRRDTIVLGAPRDSTVVQESGAAYVFTRQGQTWEEVQKLRPSNPELNAAFGTAVALEEDTIVVGAPGNEDFTGIGSAYAFSRAGGNWRQAQRLSASKGFSLDRFGLSVALSGNRLVVGQVGQIVGQPVGGVYVFAQHGVRWKEVARLTINSNEPDFFGSPVSISGNDVLVGDDTQNGIGGGTAYLFHLAPERDF